MSCRTACARHLPSKSAHVIASSGKRNRPLPGHRMKTHCSRLTLLKGALAKYYGGAACFSLFVRSCPRFSPLSLQEVSARALQWLTCGPCSLHLLLVSSFYTRASLTCAGKELRFVLLANHVSFTLQQLSKLPLFDARLKPV